MAEATPKWIDGLTYTGLSLRRGDIAMGMHDGSALGVRAGVRPGGGGLNVTLAGSTITVAAGIALVQYQAGQGIYRACQASSANLTLSAAHATLSRIDLVYLRVWDNSVDASGLNQADPVYLAGMAASSPVAPTPAGTQIYIPLATITVPPSGGGSPTVSTAVRPNTVAPGGILPSSTAPATPYVGQFYDNGTDLLRWNGSAWDTYQKVPGAWSAYTPTWTASTTNPTLGNGTMAGRYQVVGKTCDFGLDLTFGSTTTPGSGTYTFSLPVTAASLTRIIPGQALSGGGRGHLSCSIAAGGLIVTPYVPNASTSPMNQLDATGLFGVTWASGDRIRITGTYETA